MMAVAVARRASARARVCGVHPAGAIPGQIQHKCASLTPGTASSRDPTAQRSSLQGLEAAGP